MPFQMKKKIQLMCSKYLLVKTNIIRVSSMKKPITAEMMILLTTVGSGPQTSLSRSSFPLNRSNAHLGHVPSMP